MEDTNCGTLNKCRCDTLIIEGFPTNGWEIVRKSMGKLPFEKTSIYDVITI